VSHQSLGRLSSVFLKHKAGSWRSAKAYQHIPQITSTVHATHSEMLANTAAAESRANGAEIDSLLDNFTATDWKHAFSCFLFRWLQVTIQLSVQHSHREN